jgi:hypothetical protein
MTAVLLQTSTYASNDIDCGPRQGWTFACASSAIGTLIQTLLDMVMLYSTLA